MLHTRRPVLHHDENASSSSSIKPRQDKENSGLAAAGAGSRHKLQPLQPLTARKALGNISSTGTGMPEALGSSEKHGGKASLTRKALGDITNTAAKKSRALDTKPAVISISAVPVSVTKSTSSLPEVYARSGIERLLGKGWQQQEAERLQKEDEQVRQRLASMSSAFTKNQQKPVFDILQDTLLPSGYHSDSDTSSMDLSSPEPAAPMPRFGTMPPPPAQVASITEYLSPDDLLLIHGSPGACPADLLPPITCPTLSDVLFEDEEEEMLL